MRKLNGKTQIHYIRAVRRLTAFLNADGDGRALNSRFRSHCGH